MPALEEGAYVRAMTERGTLMSCVLAAAFLKGCATTVVAPPAERSREDIIRDTEAQLRRDLDKYAKGPRHAFAGATAEPRFRIYVERFMKKIEQSANANYPPEIRGIHGSLRLTIGVRPDGTLEKIDVEKSSGQPALDAAAIRLIKAASPFEEFPEDVRKDADLLYITRTFTFASAKGAGDP
jgi:TonB family protein